MIYRRHILRIGGGFLAGLASPRLPLAAEAVEIRMQGNADGSQVWFDPIGLRIQPGQTIRWINLDPGNSHTATASIRRIRAPFAFRGCRALEL